MPFKLKRRKRDEKHHFENYFQHSNAAGRWCGAGVGQWTRHTPDVFPESMFGLHQIMLIVT